MKRCVVEMRADSGATFEQGKSLALEFNGSDGPTTYTFETQRSDAGLGVDSASELVITVTGPAESLGQADSAYAMFSNTLSTVISFAVNAAVEPVRVGLAYESPDANAEGEFFQRYVRPPQSTILQHRRIDVPTLMKVFNAAVPIIAQTPRVVRALDHYRIAMLHWKPGWDVLAFNPLWLCAEVLTPVMLERELKRSGRNREQLYKGFGLKPEDFPKNLDPAVRHHLIFHGDTECYKAAKDASDGLEHGYMDFSDIHDRIRKAKNKTAGHVRRALAEIFNLDEDVSGLLFGEKYGEPLERWEHDLLVRAKIKANAEGAVAALGQTHPRFIWKNPTRAAWRGEKNLLHYQLGGDLKAQIASGAEFRHVSNELYGPTPELGSSVSAEQISKPPLSRLGISVLCDRVLSETELIAPLERVQISMFEGHILAMFWRLRSLFEAVKTLLVEHFPEEALILAGTMFEEALKLGELRLSKDSRNGLVLGWARESLLRQRDMFLAEGEWTAEIEKVIEERFKQLDSVAAEQAVSGPIQFMSVEEAIKTLGRSDYLWFFRYAKEMAKGTEIAHISRRKHNEDGVQLFAKSNDLRFIAQVARFGARALLWSADDMAEMFGRGNVTAFRELAAEFDALAE